MLTLALVAASVGAAHARGRLMLLDLLHRIQPQLGLMTPDGQNDHLDTLEAEHALRSADRARLIVPAPGFVAHWDSVRFRDYLIDYPEAAREYEFLKRRTRTGRPPSFAR